MNSPQQELLSNLLWWFCLIQSLTSSSHWCKNLLHDFQATQLFDYLKSHDCYFYTSMMKEFVIGENINLMGLRVVFEIIPLCDDIVSAKDFLLSSDCKHVRFHCVFSLNDKEQDSIFRPTTNEILSQGGGGRQWSRESFGKIFLMGGEKNIVWPSQSASSLSCLSSSVCTWSQISGNSSALKY